MLKTNLLDSIVLSHATLCSIFYVCNSTEKVTPALFLLGDKIFNATS